MASLGGSELIIYLKKKHKFYNELRHDLTVSVQNAAVLPLLQRPMIPFPNFPEKYFVPRIECAPERLKQDTCFLLRRAGKRFQSHCKAKKSKQTESVSAQRAGGRGIENRYDKQTTQVHSANVKY